MTMLKIVPDPPLFTLFSFNALSISANSQLTLADKAKPLLLTLSPPAKTSTDIYGGLLCRILMMLILAIALP
ncbi:hypothetical protein ACSMEV_00350 [Pseudomonas sp. MLB6B]